MRQGLSIYSLAGGSLLASSTEGCRVRGNHGAMLTNVAMPEGRTGRGGRQKSRKNEIGDAMRCARVSLGQESSLEASKDLLWKLVRYV